MKYGCRQPINENHRAQQELFVSIKVQRKLHNFNRHELEFLTQEYDVNNNSIGLPESDKNSNCNSNSNSWCSQKFVSDTYSDLATRMQPCVRPSTVGCHLITKSDNSRLHMNLLFW